MRVHVQYAHYIKGFEEKNLRLFSWMLNSVLNKFKMIILHFYTLYTILSFVAA